jgi:hypothetical protein
MRYVEGMIRKLTLAILLCALVACKGGSAVKLEGHWRGIKASGVPADQRTAANLFASTMELQFKGDQVSVHTGSDRQSGKFHVIKEDKTSVTIATDQDGPDDRETFTFVDDHTMDWSVMPGKTIQFARD